VTFSIAFSLLGHVWACTFNTPSFTSILQQDLLLKILALEIENKDNAERLQDEIQRKEEEIDSLRKESEKHEQQLDSLEKQVCQLHSVLEEKEQLIVQYKEREKKLEDQITEVWTKLKPFGFLQLSNVSEVLYIVAESGIVDCCWKQTY